MILLETARLILVPQALAVVQKRLETDDFTLEIVAVGFVHFSPEFPGEAFVMYPGMRDHLERGGALSPGGFVVERATREAVGEIGCKGEPVDFVADIGYGFNRGVWGRGLATEMVTAFSDHLLEGREVHAVTADTAVSNPASARVLEKSGFAQVGTGYDPDDGDLIHWRKTHG